MRALLIESQLILDALQDSSHSDFDLLWRILQSNDVQGFISQAELDRLFVDIAQSRGLDVASSLTHHLSNVLTVFPTAQTPTVDLVLAKRSDLILDSAEKLPMLSVSAYLERLTLDLAYRDQLENSKSHKILAQWFRRYSDSGLDPFLAIPIAFTLILQGLGIFDKVLGLEPENESDRSLLHVPALPPALDAEISTHDSSAFSAWVQRAYQTLEVVVTSLTGPPQQSLLTSGESSFQGSSTEDPLFQIPGDLSLEAGFIYPESLYLSLFQRLGQQENGNAYSLFDTDELSSLAQEQDDLTPVEEVRALAVNSGREQSTAASQFSSGDAEARREALVILSNAFYELRQQSRGRSEPTALTQFSQIGQSNSADLEYSASSDRTESVEMSVQRMENFSEQPTATLQIVVAVGAGDATQIMVNTTPWIESFAAETLSESLTRSFNTGDTELRAETIKVFQSAVNFIGQSDANATGETSREVRYVDSAPASILVPLGLTGDVQEIQDGHELTQRTLNESDDPLTPGFQRDVIVQAQVSSRFSYSIDRERLMIDIGLDDVAQLQIEGSALIENIVEQFSMMPQILLDQARAHDTALMNDPLACLPMLPGPRSMEPRGSIAGVTML